LEIAAVHGLAKVIETRLALLAIDCALWLRHDLKHCTELLSRRTTMHRSTEEKGKMTMQWKKDYRTYCDTLYDLEETAWCYTYFTSHVKQRIVVALRHDCCTNKVVHGKDVPYSREPQQGRSVL